jgi:hypothetical protein
MRRRTLRRALTVGVIAAAIVVVVLLILILDGVLVLPSHSPAPVTIQAVHLLVHQGNTSGGVGWVGLGSIYWNSSNSNYPVQVAPGGSWTVVWVFQNFDKVFHNITAVLPQGGFTRGITVPPLPDQLPPNTEGLSLQIPIIAPNNPGAVYAMVTVVVVLDSIS